MKKKIHTQESTSTSMPLYFHTSIALEWTLSNPLGVATKSYPQKEVTPKRKKSQKFMTNMVRMEDIRIMCLKRKRQTEANRRHLCVHRHVDGILLIGQRMLLPVFPVPMSAGAFYISLQWLRCSTLPPQFRVVLRVRIRSLSASFWETK